MKPLLEVEAQVAISIHSEVLSTVHLAHSLGLTICSLIVYFGVGPPASIARNQPGLACNAAAMENLIKRCTGWNLTANDIEEE